MTGKGARARRSTTVILALMSAIVALSPVATNAATITVTAYPAQNVSNIVINDSVYVIFTYPAGSYISNELNGSNYSLTFSAINIPRDSGTFMRFQNALPDIKKLTETGGTLVLVDRA
ncbi:MAG: hypothetical protein ACP5HT_05845 [Conexivisphaera sp.]|jgi:hypothetical protein